MKTLKTINWDFVEKHYPNYFGCDSISYLDDLQKLIDKEHENGDASTRLLINAYGGDIENPKIISDHKNLLKEIYKKAINSYSEKNNI